MPDGIEFIVEGRNRVTNWLRGLAVRLPHAVNEETEEWGAQTVNELKMQPYPPQRANSSYVRTFELRRGWKLEKLSAGAFNITNIAKQRGRLYGRYVVGDGQGQRQAWMHRGRWWNFRKVMMRLLPRLRKRIEKRIDRETR